MKIERVEVFGVAVPLVGEYSLDLTSGSIALPGGPGLGVVLDAAKRDKYRLEKAEA